MDGAFTSLGLRQISNAHGREEALGLGRRDADIRRFSGHPITLKQG